MTKPTVEIRCGAKGCNRLLGTLTNRPPPGHSFWHDRKRVAWVEPCRKHGGVPTTLDDVRERRAEADLPELDRSKLMHTIPWADLRQAFEESEKRGRRVVHLVAPLVRRL
jgi:hypothetical protein